MSEDTYIRKWRKGVTEVGKTLGENIGGFIGGAAAVSAVSSTGVGSVGASYAGFIGYSAGSMAGGWLGENLTGYSFDTIYYLYSLSRMIRQIESLTNPSINMQYNAVPYNNFYISPF